MKPPGFPCRKAFTLVELLVVIAIVALLASLLLPALSRATLKARTVQCAGGMRQVAFASRMYSDDHLDEFPRTTHSAFAFRQKPWSRALAGYLGGDSGPGWTNLFHGVYRCPAHRPQGPWSYGQNVYFELDPETDDYVGSPQTWRRTHAVPHPSATILHAEVPGPADHVMAHFWTAAQFGSDADLARHGGHANYGWVDGSVSRRRPRAVFHPELPLDAWNPALAREP